MSAIRASVLAPLPVEVTPQPAHQLGIAVLARIVDGARLRTEFRTALTRLDMARARSSHHDPSGSSSRKHSQSSRLYGHTARLNDTRTSGTPSSSKDKGKTVDMSKVMCYACNGVGHYANDPKCPKSTSSRANLRRMAEDSEPQLAEEQEPAHEQEKADDPEDQPASESSESENADGDQYESGLEYPLDDYEEFGASDARSSDEEGFEYNYICEHPLPADQAVVRTRYDETSPQLFTDLVTSALDDCDYYMERMAMNLDTVDASIYRTITHTLGVCLADEIHVNQERTPIRRLHAIPQQPYEYDTEHRLDYNEALVQRLVHEGAEMRTELALLLLGIEEEYPLPELREIASHVRVRLCNLGEEWLDFMRSEEEIVNAHFAVHEVMYIPTALDDLCRVRRQVAEAELVRVLDEEGRPHNALADDLSQARLASDSPPPLEDIPEEELEAGEAVPADLPATDTVEHIRAMMAQLHAVTDDRRVFRTAMRANGQVSNRPLQEGACMMVYCTISGLEVKALLDCGSTINCISPDFVRVANVPVFSLAEPIGLQLGCVGSRSRINFRSRTSVTLDGQDIPTYFDIVNLDHYNVIFGAPFLRTAGMTLDFASNSIRFGTHVCNPTNSIGKASNTPEYPKSRLNAASTETRNYTEADIPRLRDHWFEEYADITSGVPERLSPLREVNHWIPLVDEQFVYHYRLPCCTEAVKPLLLEKIKKYVDVQWWVPATVPQAAPLLCVAKKSGGLCTVVDCRRRNDNTIKDVTPFPDQEQIRQDVARAAVRSKIDLSDAYEQIRIAPDDVWKSAFTTVYGTMLSNVMQQGDCNAPATFQQLMTHVFRDYIGLFIHVYLDDIFVFSNSVEDHEKHLRIIFDWLREVQLYLKAEKCDLYSKKMDCLGHLINDRGLHADTDKMARVHDWRTPRDYRDIQRFLGLVQYLAHFMPDVSAFTGPLSAITRNGHSFEWRPIHQHCFESIKQLACRVPILRPIDPSKNEPIWVVCNASTSGVGALLGQEPEWKTCRPAGFMSRKFTVAQHAYRVFEFETIAILEALSKWEDKLLGRHIQIVTDHKALEFFKTQPWLSQRQTRWMEYMSRFDYDIEYVKGETNKVADCLSRYYLNDADGEVHPYDDYVSIDVRLDPEGEDLPQDHLAEVRAMRIGLLPSDKPLPQWTMVTRSMLKKAAALEAAASMLEDRHREAAELEAHAVPESKDQPPSKGEPMAMIPEEDLMPLRERVEDDSLFLTSVREGYADDLLFSKILESANDHKAFTLKEGLIWTKNRANADVLCIPRARKGNRALLDLVINHAHTTLGHYGHRRTADYIRRWYWWPTLSRDVQKWCDSCGICHTTKTSNQHLAGLLHSLSIPTRPWGSISMDFVGLFPRSHGYDYLWVVLCRLTSLTHLIPVNTMITASELAWLYIKEIVRLHGLADTIVSDCDSKFTSKFWKEVHRILGTWLLMSTAFHPQTDGATERANRSIAQILRACVKPDQSDWVDHLPMVEFAINSSISSSTGFAPFELNYGVMLKMVPALELETAIPGVRRFAQRTLDNLMMAHDAIIESHVIQTHHANKRRRNESVTDGEPDPLKAGDLVYLSTENLKFPKGRAHKLLPKFIGPFPILESHPETSTYRLQLPEDLAARGIHPTFHAKLLRRHEPNDDTMFPRRETCILYDMGQPDDAEWVVEAILGHRWVGNKVEFHVQWSLGDNTWELYSACKELEALDQYFELLGVKNWRALPRKHAVTNKK
ncbi:hypothetical protein NM688_g5811 [Phlebia brevispora]|uniref:Uncharacterized protein n=1 Tax=Phlebia brevispora TaxID=194682 RepID=A0ACC1SPI9_9APHY|nr:hypothetical protein NM688_g5811 [Phlebia brevispora]